MILPISISDFGVPSQHIVASACWITNLLMGYSTVIHGVKVVLPVHHGLMCIRWRLQICHRIGIENVVPLVFQRCKKQASLSTTESLALWLVGSPCSTSISLVFVACTRLDGQVLLTTATARQLRSLHNRSTYVTIRANQWCDSHEESQGHRSTRTSLQF